MHTGIVFIQGSHDPEQLMIKQLLKRKAYFTTFATYQGRRCRSHTAYDADGVSKEFPDSWRHVWVECRSASFTADRDTVVDHHHEGDPGYDAGAAEFWEGSSVGQVAELIGAKREQDLVLAAASDHCLFAAMRGQCPGVNPTDLMAWRVSTRAEMMDLKPWQLRRKIERAGQRIEQLPRMKIGDELVIDASFDNTPELRDAAALKGQSILTSKKDGFGRIRLSLYGADEGMVRHWAEAMTSTPNIELSYCMPSRGIAGVKLSASVSKRIASARRLATTGV